MTSVALLGPIFVVVGYGLILGITFVHFTKFLPADSPGHLLLSIFLASELLLQYSLAIWSDPGYVDQRHLVESGVEDGEQRFQRFCQHCERPKPRRAHHCRECRRCIYEMDHHCPWINNCVGYYNYRHFWLLLLYIWVSSLYVATLSAGLFVATFRTSADEASGARRERVVLDRFKVLFSFMATSVVGTVICCYWGWHVYLVLTQQSTIEFLQREGERIRLSVSVASVRHALGRMLGRQDALWFTAFVFPPFERKVPPKYMLKPNSYGAASGSAVQVFY
ncbi:hypothetical protein JG687_00009311 [Phytophthora cactorum]|uniref:Palmitoyltransferase n=1 Tax=Phytophthora cactorum TaxID=29920 RepID=A0A8T1UD27_9STRA|nr:hypothetical protein PC120_g4930 [Phytophthora cactorum]KAG3082208.1 hypothetical protein PC121_g6199 [Phytophthora cactorum]KAG4059627.1 hypothetical protein PC123_g5471 [Phytophthora cactorum]KAG6958578.1 hypothetical protein JG687_00009311 [Phytophthora cactorum]